MLWFQRSIVMNNITHSSTSRFYVSFQSSNCSSLLRLRKSNLGFLEKCRIKKFVFQYIFDTLSTKLNSIIYDGSFRTAQ